MTIGLETLDLARIHEEALLTLVLPNDLPATRQAVVRRAGVFFAEAITPIEKTHRIAHEANADLKKMIRTLNERSADLAASNRELQRQITQRKAMEESLRRSQQHYGQLLAQSIHMQEQLRLLSRQLLSAQEQERKMISRELHDVVAQTLTSINVRLANLKKEALSNTKGLDRKIARTQRLVEKSVNVVHRFARELRPAVLDDLGLIPALHTFLKGFRHETGIRVSLSAFAAVEQVNGDKRTVLYRVAQEALANVARHAQASRAEVKIQKLDDAVCMKIRDNGKGFHEESALRAKRGKRLGLLGMRERLDMVGGKFSIESAPGRGTTILAWIPLGQASKAL
jgi:signal transduction histidine kinase